MIEQLKLKWFEHASKYNSSNELIEKLWDEIFEKYTEKNRCYHNLSHINDMLIQAEEVEDAISNYDAVLFAIWYHDIVYKSTKKDNEEKSANFCEKRLKSLKIDEKQVKIIQTLIISTKNHQIILTENNDNAYLLDIDISILGSNWKNYHKYLKNIRKEYAIFPKFIYKKGRKKVLEHFLKRATIYFTETYQKKYEKQARENLKKEIKLL